MVKCNGFLLQQMAMDRVSPRDKNCSLLYGNIIFKLPYCDKTTLNSFYLITEKISETNEFIVLLKTVTRSNRMH